MTDIKCTVTNVAVKYPYGEQAQDDTQAALTAVAGEKAETETTAREASFAVLLPGDLRTEFPEGGEVTLSITGGTAGPLGGHKPEGAAASHAQPARRA
jgi:hypothetical protein